MIILKLFQYFCFCQVREAAGKVSKNNTALVLPPDRRKNERKEERTTKCHYHHLLFYVYLFTTVLSPWDFSHGQSGLPSPEKARWDRVELPNPGCTLGVLVFSSSTGLWHGLQDLQHAHRVNACDCARRCTDTVRESAVKVDSRRKVPFRTGESNMRRRLPTELHPNPTHHHNSIVCLHFLTVQFALIWPTTLTGLKSPICPYMTYDVDWA